MHKIHPALHELINDDEGRLVQEEVTSLIVELKQRGFKQNAIGRGVARSLVTYCTAEHEETSTQRINSLHFLKWASGLFKSAHDELRALDEQCLKRLQQLEAINSELDLLMVTHLDPKGTA